MCVGSLGCLLRRQWGKFLAKQTGDSAYVCFVRPIWVGDTWAHAVGIPILKPSAYYDRLVDVMEELVKFTLLTRGASGWLTNRYSERKVSAEALAARVNQRSL